MPASRTRARLEQLAKERNVELEFELDGEDSVEGQGGIGV
jgi:hypothetical protein